MTYFPFVRFFFDTIVSFLSKEEQPTPTDSMTYSHLLDKIKLSRIVTFSEKEGEANDVFQSVDIGFLQKVMYTELWKHLTGLYRYPIPQCGSNLSFHIENDSISYQLLGKDKIYMSDALWACPIVFTNFPFEDFYWLFIAFLLENHIVLISENYALLTATL